MKPEHKHCTLGTAKGRAELWFRRLAEEKRGWEERLMLGLRHEIGGRGACQMTETEHVALFW